MLADTHEETQMAECECLAGCPFFNDQMKDSQALGSIYKQHYCHGDNSKCARYMVYKKLGKPNVPTDLYPNMLERATDILAGK